MPHVAHPAQNFAMLPIRAFADKRFRTRHFRVLGALCKSYDSDTGCALVSQAKIAERANLSRLLVNRTLPDLVDWGYLTRTKRGRRRGGQFKTHLYGVLWEERHVNNGVYTDHVNPGGYTTVSTPGFTDSYPSFSKLNSSSQTYTRRGVARSAQPGGFAGSDAPLDAAKGNGGFEARDEPSNIEAGSNDRKNAHQTGGVAPRRSGPPSNHPDVTKADKLAREFEADAILAQQLEIDVADLRKLRALQDQATEGWSPNRRVALDLEIRRETEGMLPAEALAFRRNRYQKFLETGDAGQPGS